MWIPLVVILLAGCAPPGCEVNWNSDPCPGHASSGNLFESSDCDCPLDSQIGPQLEGQSCSPSGQTCYSGGFFSGSCSCVTGHWSCGARDLSVPHDLFEPDLSLPFDLRDSDGGD